MRKLYTTFLCLVAVPQLLLAQDQKIIARNPDVITGKLIKVTDQVKNFKRPSGWVDVPVRDENGRIWPNNRRPAPHETTIYPEQQNNTDGAAQSDYSQPRKSGNGVVAAARAITTNFNGMGYTFVNPPDPTICAGPNHIIQMINGSSGAYFKVFNKSGAQVVAQTYLDQITGYGGLGDPIAQYDQLADRFVLMEFANSAETGNQEGLIIAVTQTPDPAGSWFVYFFPYGSTFPDYPKLSVWSDAYYCTTNDFAGSLFYSGSSAWAFNRNAMLAGAASVSAQRFTLGSTDKHFSMCPVLLQGNALPTAGTGGLIAYMQDNAWTSSTLDVDSIGLFEFDVNFASPASSVITHRASLAAASYKADICTATRGRCITQPGSSVALEALHEKVMNQPVYRNFGTYEGIVLTHVVDKGSSISGVRWYELNKTTGNWSVNQQSTYTPDNTHRFMPSICYDSRGNIALVYNVSSSSTSTFAGVRYTGRKQCDAPNAMTYSEDVIIAGTAANTSNRYGDYNQVVADPDGVTFWTTAEWNGASQWSTRIASFTLDACGPVCNNPGGLTSSAITTNSATVSWTAVSEAVSYDVDYKANSSSTWINAATATSSTSVGLGSLAPSTLYDWRVRTNCASGSSTYTTAQFTTAAVPPPCGTPTGLGETSITTNSARLNWAVVTNATSYNVQYKASSSGTWLDAGTTSNNFFDLGGLSASTLYNWRVQATCPEGTGNYAEDQFTTAAPPVTCPGPLDVSTNGTTGGAATMSLNTNVLGTINPRGDNDYYRFVITTGGTVSLTLSTLPANYQLALTNSGGGTIATSQSNGTSSEAINNVNLAAGTYYARVFPKGNASSTSCYTLRVTTGTATLPDELTRVQIGRQLITVFPNPTTHSLQVDIAGVQGTVRVSLFDITGRLVKQRSLAAEHSSLDISSLSAGTYTVRFVTADGETRTVKVVKQ